ncbi:dihydropteroate synthase [Alteromonas ponticola]|uniref:Dihydropteroate synthase n=1 Tax=Alteromonas aquimaris TaxID=2998417 RepID=A0ABT3P761_9ALTE|nr:dihydropteroate synthase [Alteromonas aquimaris]MCW8108610.1 dihydropteroate synthase [Alteromonas aquimaris]
MKFKDKHIDLSTPHVMGILNVTPDSFSDGGRFNSLNSALSHARRMIDNGASFIDVGGESTRPGANTVSEAEELDRVIPIIEALKKETDCVISVDTNKALVMREAVDAGATLINDVYALRNVNALETAAKLSIPVCLMHMQGNPQTMQDAPQYADIVKEIRKFFKQRVEECVKAGIKKENILLDPGFGFGKTLQHNYQLLKELNHISVEGLPLLVGMSNKSMLGKLLQREVNERLAGNVAVATIAALNGAKILRVHDVEQTCDAIKIVNYLNALEK